MKILNIPVEFFKALEGCPPEYRLLWVSWLTKPDLLFLPTFSENQILKEIPLKKVKECYEAGIKHLHKGFISKPESVSIETILEIVNYLNKVAGTEYSYKSKQTQELISARIKEGYSKKHFFVVIDKKVSEWKNTEMAIYIRPITLFSASKFESYLNQLNNGKQQHKNSGIQKLSDAVSKAKSKLFD